MALAAVEERELAGPRLKMWARPLPLVAAAVLFAPVACNGNSDAPGAGISSSGSGGGTAAASGSGGASFVDDTTCDRAPCEGFTVGGLAYAACCIPAADACGVRVGNTCVDRTAFSPPTMGSVGGAFDLGDPEVVVPDPTCPPLTSVMGMAVNMAGCCDSTGVCGVSTAGIGKTMGFEIPPMCVTASDPLGKYLSTGDAPIP